MNRVSDKIDRLIKKELEAHPERLASFFEQVESNYAEAIRNATAFLIFMLAAWFLTFAIYAGWIDKITFFGTELKKNMILVSPFLIGLLSYLQLSALAGAAVLWEVVSRGVFHMLPTAWKHSLDDLLAPPTFSNIERMLEPKPENRLESLFSRAWFVLVGLMIFGGSLAALVHTTYLVFTVQVHVAFGAVVIGQDLSLALAFAVVSAFLGAAAWLRGVFLFVSAVEATGGFNVGHHRGSGRVGI